MTGQAVQQDAAAGARTVDAGDALPPVVSIITVVYNAGALLAPTIEAIARLRYPRVEYIVVDGGSTDDTLAVVDRYREMITHFISEPDHGIYDAMNKDGTCKRRVPASPTSGPAPRGPAEHPSDSWQLTRCNPRNKIHASNRP